MTATLESARVRPATPERVAAEASPAPRAVLPGAVWKRVWPGLLAVVLVVGAWQLVFWSGWKPDYVLPSPAEVGGELAAFVAEPKFWQALGNTLFRAVLGFGTALAIGTALGIAVSASRVLRAAIGSLLTGLQTMPSIAWFPFAILLFGLTENAIMFVVVLGAAPSIANGLISGIDDVPPPLLRTAQVLGARGATLYRHVILPSALPTYVAGLKQGWAFAWRSLMAGELLVVIPGAVALGNRLAFAQEFGDAAGLLAYMLVILLVGMLADTGFSAISRGLRRRRGLSVR